MTVQTVAAAHDSVQDGEQTPTLLQAILHQERRYYSELALGKVVLPAAAAEIKGVWLPTPAARNLIGEWSLRSKLKRRSVLFEILTTR
jgi:hypothetical protein